MTDPLKEQLSAFLDGELPAAEAELFLKRLERDDSLVAALSRYSLIGDAMRAEGGIEAARPVASRVSAAIAREPALPAAGVGSASPRGWRRHVAGLSVAASVALAAVVLVGRFGTGGPESPAVVAAVAPAPESPATSSVVVEQVAAVTPVIDAPQGYTTPSAPEGELAPVEFANFLVAHSEQASYVGRRAIVTGLIAAPPEPLEPTAKAGPAQ
ncbi:MAG: sigma-E factor negative regulatory protein [Gammaproteobacteria bacterium]|nr:sigma-E factor negative regulatory protein [Gammaproteobacteria bacterium]